MLARIDGAAVPLEALWWPDMNFNQFRWAAPLGEYELEIPRKVFVDGMTAEYAQVVAMIRHDDEIELRLGYPPSSLREIGYPPLNVALDHPRQASELVGVDMHPRVFETFLPFVPFESPSARFMMNSIDAVSVTPSAVLIRGRGYHTSRYPPHSTG